MFYIFLFLIALVFFFLGMFTQFLIDLRIIKLFAITDLKDLNNLKDKKND